MKVVIIDDHTLFREGLQGLLERHGIEIVASIGNSQDGIKAAQELNPDVLLLDLRMPEMGGLEILEKLQEYKFKKPVVVTDVGSFRDTVEDGKTGIIVPPGDPQKLASAIIELLDNPKKRTEMGLAGHQKLINELSWESIAKRTNNVYRQILGLTND